jgi:hypothetical protein
MKRSFLFMSIIFGLVFFLGVCCFEGLAAEDNVIVFEDDFGDPAASMQKWAVVSGGSFVHFEQGYVRLEGISEPANFIWIEPNTDFVGLDNYELEYHIRIPQRGNGWYGFYMSKGHIRVRVFVQNTWTALGWVSGGSEEFLTENWDWSPNTWYQLKIVVRESQLTICFNKLGEELVERKVRDYTYDLTRTYITLEQTKADIEIGYVRISCLAD